MTDPFVSIVVAVPEKHFPDDDDICLAAGNHVCAQLEQHLLRQGHTIPDWIQGGCEEDWGVYFQSQHTTTTFEYHICFFPAPTGTLQNQMLIQYNVKNPFLKRLFSKPEKLPADHPIHETMRTFGQTFSSSRLLTQAEFEKEY